MGTYKIGADEILDGNLNISPDKDTNRYGLAEFLQSFEGDVCAEELAAAWNKLAEQRGWDDRLIHHHERDMISKCDGCDEHSAVECRLIHTPAHEEDEAKPWSCAFGCPVKFVDWRQQNVRRIEEEEE